MNKYAIRLGIAGFWLLMGISTYGQNRVLDFDGVDDHIFFESIDLFSGNYTIEVKMYAKSQNAFKGVLDFGNGLGDNNVWLGSISSTGRLAIEIWNAGQPFSTVTVQDPFPVNQWIHVTVSFDGVEGKIYYDCIEKASGPLVAPTSIMRTSNFVAGSNWPDPISEFVIDEIRIWDKALSLAEISLFKDSVMTGMETDLAALWDMNETHMDSVFDKSGNLFHGELRGLAGGLAERHIRCSGIYGPFDDDEDGICSNVDCDDSDPLNTGILDCEGVCNGSAVDQDQDGYCNYEDCDDNDPSVHYLSCSGFCTNTVPTEAAYYVQGYYLITTDHIYSQEEFDSIYSGMIEIQSWYQVATGGITFHLNEDEIVKVVHLPNDSMYYGQDYWGRILTDMSSMGYPVWSPGTINLYWVKGGGGVALGAQGCEGNCGESMVGMDLFPSFNTGIYFDCPPFPGGAPAWPCIPIGAPAHELGHCFGLPHPPDGHSLMSTHWNYPYTFAPPAESPWGLLTYEIQVLMSNPFFCRDIDLQQLFEEMPVVNIPSNGPPPNASFSYEINGGTVTFTNTSSGHDQSYWTFGDGTVSNYEDVAHGYNAIGSFNARLRVMKDIGMVDMHSETINIVDECPDDIVLDVPISTGVYKAQNTISVSGMVAGSEVRFEAGGGIDLENGFVIDGAKQVVVQMDGCD